jgi:hypothetical protein
LADLPGDNCYKLKVIEYYYDNSNREIDWKKRNFRITFQIDGIINCTGTSDNVNDIDQNYKNIEIDLKIPWEVNKYTATLKEKRYTITAIDTNGNKKEMVLIIIDQKNDVSNRINDITGLAEYYEYLRKLPKLNKIISGFDPYQFDRFRRRTYDGKDNIPEYEELLKNFNKISDNYYVIGQFEKNIHRIEHIMNEQVERIEDGEKREFYGKYYLQFDSTVFNDVYEKAQKAFEIWRRKTKQPYNDITSWLELEEGKSNIDTILNGKKDDVTIEVVGKVGLDDDDVKNDGKLFDNEITGEVNIFMDEGARKEFALLYLKSDIRREEMEENTGRVRGLDNQVFHLTIERNRKPKRIIPVKIIATFFTDNDNEYTPPVIKLVVDKAEETRREITRIDGGAPRKSRRANKSRKAHKSKKSGRKSRRKSRR